MGFWPFFYSLLFLGLIEAYLLVFDLIGLNFVFIAIIYDNWI